MCSLTLEDSLDGAKDKNEKHVLMSLKTLLFYSVFTYFVTKTKDIWSSTPTRSMFQNHNLFEAICRILLEWAKAIIVIICLREQGIYFKPSVPYAVITFTYYLCTEKIFLEIFKATTQYFVLDFLENLDHLYVPFVLNIYTIVITTLIQIYLITTTTHPRFCLITSYLVLYIRIKDTYYNWWMAIKLEKQIYESFRSANKTELEEYDDVCAVCLNKMSRAKITPCNHYFHPICLKECLKSSLLCPICKLNF